MRLNRIVVLSLWLPLSLFAQSYGLKSYIEYAQKTNGEIKAKEIGILSKQQGVEAAESAYWPTLDIGASYKDATPNYVVSPGRVASGFASLNLELYDGGRKSAIVNAKSFEREASLFEKRAFEKSITLKIVQHYYAIQQLKATLHALQERSKELKAQIERVKKFMASGLSTQEEVDKLQSVFDGNQYTMENTKLAIETNEQNLKLLSGLPATGLKQSRFIEPKKIAFEWFDPIKIMQAKANAIGENANAIDANYMPQVSVSDTYHKSHFDDLVSSPMAGDGFLIDHQNELTLSATMRLFDHGKMAKESEAVKYQKMALLSQLDQAKKEQRMNFGLARQNLRTTRAKIKSAKSALRAATSTYGVLKQKFEVGLIDDVSFLDALATKTLAQSRYEESIYEYEIKKSIYYYYAGKDPKEFIR
ncbi:MAG TPA: TolC family protein [Epsilonproteobacteria bacterium]|nr:TolC family protein [Campylobacterota bacterium]